MAQLSITDGISQASAELAKLLECGPQELGWNVPEGSQLPAIHPEGTSRGSSALLSTSVASLAEQLPCPPKISHSPHGNHSSHAWLDNPACPFPGGTRMQLVAPTLGHRSALPPRGMPIRLGTPACGCGSALLYVVQLGTSHRHVIRPSTPQRYVGTARHACRQSVQRHVEHSKEVAGTECRWCESCQP
eukprot:365888-Chlamydomonas_euryale.AAC.7